MQFAYYSEPTINVRNRTSFFFWKNSSRERILPSTCEFFRLFFVCGVARRRRHHKRSYSPSLPPSFPTRIVASITYEQVYNTCKKEKKNWDKEEWRRMQPPVITKVWNDNQLRVGGANIRKHLGRILVIYLIFCLLLLSFLEKKKWLEGYSILASSYVC